MNQPEKIRDENQAAEEMTPEASPSEITDQLERLFRIEVDGNKEFQFSRAAGNPEGHRAWQEAVRRSNEMIRDAANAGRGVIYEAMTKEQAAQLEAEGWEVVGTSGRSKEHIALRPDSPEAEAVRRVWANTPAESSGSE